MAAGSAEPVLTRVTVGEVSWVMERFVAVPEGRTSETVPLSVTESPTVRPGAEPVETKMPSLVAGLASGVGSCR